MRLRFATTLCTALLGSTLCGPGSPPTRAVDDLESPPAVTEADRAFADVFRSLDGTWRGEFKIYETTGGQAPAPVRPRDIEHLPIPGPGMRLTTTLQVRQTYVSESPFFQRVTIEDRYADGRTVRSRGVNKVQDGKLWCVVQKPDETVIHEGRAPHPGLILWERDLRAPLKIEFFHETVRANTYTIRGWGYYGQDDPDRAPRLWFHGAYRRVP